jgi:hypothetical protein
VCERLTYRFTVEENGRMLLIGSRGRAKTIVSDNGTELTSNAILSWADQTKVGGHYIAPGKPCKTPSSKAAPVVALHAFAVAALPTP